MTHQYSPQYYVLRSLYVPHSYGAVLWGTVHVEQTVSTVLHSYGAVLCVPTLEHVTIVLGLNLKCSTASQWWRRVFSISPVLTSQTLQWGWIGAHSTQHVRITQVRTYKDGWQDWRNPHVWPTYIGKVNNTSIKLKGLGQVYYTNFTTCYHGNCVLPHSKFAIRIEYKDSFTDQQRLK